MPPLILEKREPELCRNVQFATPIELGESDEVRAEVLRRVILGLPVADPGSVEPEAVGERADKLACGAPCPLTGAGIHIRGGVIVGRLDLDFAIGDGGGPICPLVFENTRFSQGLSAVQTKFSRLSLRKCSFGASAKEKFDEPMPTIDLSNASVNGDLDMQEIEPARTDGFLSIRAPGLRVDGTLKLSNANLRARPGEGDVLDLALATIDGDLHFLDGKAIGGRVTLRGARVAGDVWMSRATVTHRGEQALHFQSARIAGFLMMNRISMPGLEHEIGACFSCTGDLNLEATQIGCSLYLNEDAWLQGTLEAPGLSVGDNAILGLNTVGKVDLRGCQIDGSLDLSRLVVNPDLDASKAAKPGHDLSLADGKVGRVLRLSDESGLASDFSVGGEIDLRGLVCDTLDDRAGALWGRPRRIKMNHFVYRQAIAGNLDERESLSTFRRLYNWARSGLADHLPSWMIGWFFHWFGLTGDLREDDVCWSDWQIRRNWLYRQFKPAAPALPAQRHVEEFEYRPQPFERALRVARAEGREDIATHFEMLKARIEWRLFNLRIRWMLGVAGMLVATGWMILRGATWWLAVPTCLITLGVMSWASVAHKLSQKKRALTEIAYYLPTLILILIADGWWGHPFHFMVALGMYLAVRYLSVFANLFMRLGFGYMRRPGRAVVTLILAFIVGWWGVHHADKRNMLVITAEPVADLAAPYSNASFPRGYDASGAPVIVTGSAKVEEGPRFAHELSCAAHLSEPLYALDTLIPLVDLGEAERCETRRFPDSHHGRHAADPTHMSFFQILQSWPTWTLDDHRFWWWMKALYAIAGWVIVSLSLLTFAQANRTHAEPPTE